jgi:hypothetical protein
VRWNFFVYILWSYPFESGNDISSILLESIVVTTAPTQGENWAFAVTTPATSPRQVFFFPLYALDNHRHINLRTGYVSLSPRRKRCSGLDVGVTASDLG